MSCWPPGVEWWARELQIQSNWYSYAWRAASLLAGVGLFFVVLFSLSFGTCHSVSGICSGEFGQENRDAFYTALFVSIAVGPLFVLPFTRKPRWLLLSALASLLATGVVVLIFWP